MKSLFKEYKTPIFLGLLAVIVNVGYVCILAYNSSKEQRLTNRLISVCEFQIKTSASHPDLISFDSNSGYVITTSNSKIWHVYGKASVKMHGYEKVYVGTFCRIVKIDNNLQVDRWEYHIEK